MAPSLISKVRALGLAPLEYRGRYGSSPCVRDSDRPPSHPAIPPGLGQDESKRAVGYRLPALLAGGLSSLPLLLRPIDKPARTALH